MKAPINKIINFSNIDGPGNRMVIFFQKCPNTCLFCHNPETINMCINCGDCIATCPTNALTMIDKKINWNVSKCINCDNCIHICKYLASPKITFMSVDDLIIEIKKHQTFIKGITVSGGECMNYPDFLTELFREVSKLHLTCLIDSSGYFDFSKYPDLLAVTTGVMLDVKAFDNKFYKYLTGNDNNDVFVNLKYLLSINKLEEARTVLFPNTLKENFETVDQVSKIIGDNSTYKLLRYRPFGVRKEGLNALGNIITDKESSEKLVALSKNNGCIKTILI